MKTWIQILRGHTEAEVAVFIFSPGTRKEGRQVANQHSWIDELWVQWQTPSQGTPSTNLWLPHIWAHMCTHPHTNRYRYHSHRKGVFYQILPSKGAWWKAMFLWQSDKVFRIYNSCLPGLEPLPPSHHCCVCVHSSAAASVLSGWPRSDSFKKAFSALVLRKIITQVTNFIPNPIITLLCSWWEGSELCLWHHSGCWPSWPGPTAMGVSSCFCHGPIRGQDCSIPTWARASYILVFGAWKPTFLSSQVFRQRQLPWQQGFVL